MGYPQFDLSQLRKQSVLAPSNPYFNPLPQMPEMQDYSELPDIGESMQIPQYQPQAQVFGQNIPNPTVPTYGPSPEDPRNPNRIWDMINKIYTPETQSRDRINNLLDNYPERESPSLMRRIVAGGLGLKSDNPLETMEKAMYAPHMRDVADWKERVTPSQAAYTTENAANINERTLAGNAVAAQATMDKNDEIARNNEEKNNIARITALARQAREAKWTIKQYGTQIIATSPDGQQSRVIGNVKGKLSDADKIELEGQWDVKAAEAAGKSRQDIANENAPIYQDKDGNLWERRNGTWQPADLPGRKSDAGPITEVGKPSAAANKPQTPAAMEYDRQRRLEFIYQNYPDYKNEGFIKYNSGTGKYTLAKRPEHSLFHLDSTDDALAAKYDKMMEMLNEGVEPPKGMTKPASSTDRRPGQVVTPDDRTREQMRAQIEIDNAKNKANRPNQLRNILADPSTPNALKPIIQRELDALEGKGTSPIPPQPQSQSNATPPPTKAQPIDQGNDVYVYDAQKKGYFYMRPDAFAIAQKQSPGRFSRVR